MSKLQHSKKYTRHPFHIVDPSPWPFIGAFSALFLTLNITFLLHGYTKLAGIHGCWNCFYGVLFSMYMWWRNIVHEATFEGQHTKEVQQGLKIGIILFIISEIMFFLVFFGPFLMQVFRLNMQLEVYGRLMDYNQLILGEFHY
jgi:hypothetical protein